MSVSSVSGVMLGIDDAAFLSAALRRLIEVSAQRGGRAVPRVYELEHQLASAAKCSVEGTSEWLDEPRPAVSEMQLIETSTAAARLGVSDRNVRALAARGTLTARRVAGRWLIDADAVEERSQKRGNQLP